MVPWVLVLAVVAGGYGFEITDEQYYLMPRLFHLDDWERCMARRGVYCLGSFDLMPTQHNDTLFDVIQRFSSNKYHFNHTHIHRGVCLSSSCSHVHASTLRGRFSACVNNVTVTDYGLQTNLTELQYCTSGRSRPVDEWDVVFAYIVGVILVMNVVGTAYDVLRSPDGKGIKQLTAWSLVANWQRLTADYSEGDPRLAALKPVQGMKSLTLLLIMMAHSVLAYSITYIYNPQFLEKSSHELLSAYFQNGTSIVQTFIMISSFLLAYNLLLHAADNPKKQLSLKMLPKCLMHRIVRISPVYMFTLGVATTWWAHAGSGPLWTPLVEAEADRCRLKWWAQALYVHNFVDPDVKCLIHTWFLAVDMQLYVVCAILTLALGRWTRVAPKVIAGLIVSAIVVNFAIIYNWHLKPMVLLMFPEFMRTQFKGESSFTWLYTAPWDSLPSALVGLFVAFVYHSEQADGYQAHENWVIRVMYRVSIPGMFLWVVGGYWMKGLSHPLLVALYATLDRPVFISLTAFAMYGFFHKIDSLCWRFLSWRGWEVLGRMSLCVYLAHWLLALLLLAQRSTANRASVFDIGGHWLSTIFLTYCSAVPLHLLVEVPAMKFLQSFTS